MPELIEAIVTYATLSRVAAGLFVLSPLALLALNSYHAKARAGRVDHEIILFGVVVFALGAVIAELMP